MVNVYCKYFYGFYRCNNEKVKRNFFGFGQRMCVFQDNNAFCEHHEYPDIYSKRIPPPAPKGQGNTPKKCCCNGNGKCQS